MLVDLEGVDDAAARPASPGREPGDVAARRSCTSPAVGSQAPADGGRPGSSCPRRSGPIRRADLAAVQAEVHAPHGLEAAESLSQMPRVSSSRGHGSHAAPPGPDSAHDAGRRPQGHDDERDTHHQEVRGREAARDVHDVGHHQRAHQRAQHGPGAAQQGPQERVDGVEDTGAKGGAHVREQERVGGPRDGRAGAARRGEHRDTGRYRCVL